MHRHSVVASELTVAFHSATVRAAIQRGKLSFTGVPAEPDYGLKCLGSDVARGRNIDIKDTNMRTHRLGYALLVCLLPYRPHICGAFFAAAQRFF